MKRNFIVLVLLLIFIDQAIKIPVSKLLPEPDACLCLTLRVNVTLIEGIFYFKPMQNIHGGWIPNMLDYMMPIYIGVPITVLGIIIFIATYRFMMYWAFDWDKYKNLPVVFLTAALSGGICSLIDTVFWGGSVDYILLFDWFIFDLKDVYLSFSGATLVLYVIIFCIKYYRLSKEERREFDKNFKFFGWLKSGLPLKPG